VETIELIGKQIAFAHKERGLRQLDLAKNSNLSRATSDALENGRASEIGISKLSRILAVLGLELAIRPSSARHTLDELLKLDGDE